MSFVRVVYPLKYLSNVCLSCLDNGPLLLECTIILECQNVIGVLLVSRCLSKTPHTRRL